ncbi:MAG: hypothetical protein M1834_009500 [Cirrosporium novae-zelandiae]|nr:MAG: hypothetical protein M1834_009500 [Cirrosporium novae-zelandiae]
MNEADEVGRVFQEAHKKFLDSIAEDERSKFSKCSSAEDLLADVSRLLAILKEKRRGKRMLKQIKHLSDSLQPYFKVIEIFVQCKPEWISLASVLEAIRCSFWRSLARMEFNKKLVDDELLLDQCRQSNDARRASFEEHCKNECARQKAIEAAQEGHELLAEVKRAFEEEQLDRVYHRLRSWVSPPAFMQEFERAQDLRDEGNPGCGETVLAASAIEKLRDSGNRKERSDRMVCYFFFNQNSSEQFSSFAAYRAFLSQILQRFRKDDTIRTRISFAMTQESEGQITASRAETFGLLQLCLQDIQNAFLVLDAVDECEDNGDLVNDLKRLSQISTVHILLFSRPVVEVLHRAISTAGRYVIEKHSVNQDIKVYLQNRVQLLKSDQLLPQYCDIAQLVARLLQGADGMFLWARLMIAYLNSPILSSAERIDPTQQINLPEGLEQMYCKMESLVGRSYVAEQNMARRAFLWLNYSDATLTCQQLHLAMASESNHAENRPFKEFSHAIVMACAGLVEVYPLIDDDIGSKCVFRYIHISVKDYLRTPGKQAGDSQTQEAPIFFTKIQANLQIARSYLAYSIFQMPAQPLSGILGKEARHEELTASFPLLQLASTTWITYLCRYPRWAYLSSKDRLISKLFEEFMSMLERFMSLKFVVMAWIEAWYTLSLAINFPSFAELRGWVDSCKQSSTERQNVYRDLSDFSADLDMIHNSWRTTLFQRPHEIWGDVTAFSQSRFFARTSTLRVTSFPPTKSKKEQSSQPLATISKVEPNGKEIGVLSAWPSFAYEQLCRDTRSYSSPSEIYHTDREQRFIAAVTIPLEEFEIWLLLWQALQPKTWKLIFPMTISNDLLKFTAMRNIFMLRREQFDPVREINYTSLTLPLDFDEHLRSNWSDARTGSQFLHERSFPLFPGLVCPDLYEYGILISPNGQFVLFYDDDHSLRPYNSRFEPVFIKSYFGAILDNLSFLAVYQLNTDTPSCGSRLVNSLPIHSEKGFCRRKCFFHPFGPVIGFIQNSTVQLWNFKTEFICQVYEKYLFEYIMSRDFSACGKYIVINITGSRPPVTIPVDHYILGDETEHVSNLAQTISTASQSLDPKPEISRLTDSSRCDALALLASQTLSTRDNTVIHGQNQEVLINNPQLNSIDLKHPTDAISPLRLPREIRGADTTTIARFPESIHENIKITVNAAAKPFYQITERPNSLLPALVERDPRSLLLEQGAAGPASSSLINQKEEPLQKLLDKLPLLYEDTLDPLTSLDTGQKELETGLGFERYQLISGQGNSHDTEEDF